VSIAAFGLSAAMFSMFLYLTLLIQNQLEYGPLEAGLRFLPMTLVSFVAAPVAARLQEGRPARWFFGGGLLLVGIGLLLMRSISPGDDWEALLPGLLVAGLGVGVVNPIIASVAVGVVEPREAGMASGINSTFRQVGIATGIAALGAVFQGRIESRTPGDTPGDVLSNVPLSRLPESVRDAAHAGFVGALDDILLIAALVAFAAAAGAVALVRA
jgi:predicted MFS family arabinose efflux permease